MPLMAKDYSGGQQTLIWLGKADWWTVFAFWCLWNASEACARHPWLAAGSGEWYIELARREAATTGGEGPLRWGRGLWDYIQYLGTYKALGSVIGRRYFTRA